MTEEQRTPEGEGPQGTAAPSPEAADLASDRASDRASDQASDRASDQASEPPRDAEVSDTAAVDAEAAPATEPGAEGGAEGGDSAAADELTVTQMELAERTADLQRLQAEFVNYKRRVERDRELVNQNATYKVLVPIIEVLDTIDRANEHARQSGQSLDEGFKAVADQLERVVSGLGLSKFGEPGDAFDPSLHEALSHIGEDADVEVTTCKVIAKAGYRFGERVVRAAQVLVVDPPAATA